MKLQLEKDWFLKAIKPGDADLVEVPGISDICLGDDDYKKYRGKCKEFAEELCQQDSTLKLVRGYYHCPVWQTKEAHWWCVKPDGTIVDPTAKQFGSKGCGTYEEFDGTLECAECKKKFREEELGKGPFIDANGNYVYCSSKCYAKFVGLDFEEEI